MLSAKLRRTLGYRATWVGCCFRYSRKTLFFPCFFFFVSIVFDFAFWVHLGQLDQCTEALESRWFVCMSLITSHAHTSTLNGFALSKWPRQKPGIAGDTKTSACSQLSLYESRLVPAARNWILA